MRKIKLGLLFMIICFQLANSFAQCIINNGVVMVMGNGVYFVGRNDLLIEGGSNITANIGEDFMLYFDGDIRIDLMSMITGNVDISCENLFVEGEINVSEKGELSCNGIAPGSNAIGLEGAEGGYYAGAGGVGENLSSSSGLMSYGSVFYPETYGSGGGTNTTYFNDGGVGGGKVRIIVANMFIVDGFISANGGNGKNSGGSAGGGGGAGGAIWIECFEFDGIGEINVNGGNGGQTTKDGGGGSGGRIAIYYFTKSFIGLINTFGGNGYSAQEGAAGTYYDMDIEEFYGDLYIVNSYSPTNNFQIARTLIDITEITTYNSIIVDDGGMFCPVGKQASEVLTLHIKSHGMMTGDSVEFTCSTLSLDLFGRIDFNKTGNVSGVGVGAGDDVFGVIKGGGGGAHGGNGGDGQDAASTGGLKYGSNSGPITRGSGGGANITRLAKGGKGGGAVMLTVCGVCTINGIACSNGENGEVGIDCGGGGGSGGTIWIVCETLVGSTGQITANGGHGANSTYSGGGGGGGRIAIYKDFDFYSGASPTVSGGVGFGGSQNGSTGTVFAKGYYGCAPLPIELLLFEGKWKNEKQTEVFLNWITVSEINNDYFEIQRKINEQWRVIATVLGAGNSSSKIDYNYIDKLDDEELSKEYKKTIYYRLKQIDYNDNHTYSNIISFDNINKNKEFQFQSGLFENGININYVVNEDDEIYINIYDDIGKCIYSDKRKIFKEKNWISINFSNQPNAIYIVNIVSKSGFSYSSKVIRK